MTRAPLAAGEVVAPRTAAPHVAGPHARRLRPRVAARGRRRRHGRRPARRARRRRTSSRRRGRGAGHWPGAARPLRAVALADGRAESPLETRGRLRIVGAGLPTPELQVEIRAGGRLVAVVDAWFDDAAVAVEFDGRVKYTDPWRDRSPEQVLWEEKRREDELRALDIRVVRIADADLGAGWPATSSSACGSSVDTRARDPAVHRARRARAGCAAAADVAGAARAAAGAAVRGGCGTARRLRRRAWASPERWCRIVIAGLGLPASSLRRASYRADQCGHAVPACDPRAGPRPVRTTARAPPSARRRRTADGSQPTPPGVRGRKR